MEGQAFDRYLLLGEKRDDLLTLAEVRRPLLVAVQVFERVQQDSLAEVAALLTWSALKIYNINAAGHNHGVLLGTLGWSPR
jgi:hypothetical protein